VAKPDLFSRDVRLLRKEYVSGFYFGHNIRVSLDLPSMDVKIQAAPLPHSETTRQTHFALVILLKRDIRWFP
jgi:hypothetical protein